ncbi:MAG: serine/threonine-protein kinase, partial [Wenzhouxiangella sp.]|nr:serine/threonine-protein kinase [Wenzhouxiangella sp.]
MTGTDSSTGAAARPASAGSRLLDQIAQAYASQVQADATADLPGELFGNYRLIERVGRGGMGDVYRAERADGAFQAQVAVKLLRASIDSEAMTRRFVRERQILARLNHPHIARLLGGGANTHGLPFLVMEWIDGQPLTDFAAANALDLNQRLALFLDVCDAVAYAHRNLIVHRDLKPSNILVDQSGQVKLLDFGVSKLLAADSDDAEILTRTGALMMTPAYAAPEQILDQPVTTATDTYALGVVLYELITGQRPHNRDAQTPAALAANVDTEPFTRPSELLARKARHLSERRLARRLRGDLDTVLQVALRREPERRYPSVEALAEDLRRFQRGLPIAARPDSMGYRLGKFLTRHRAGVAASVAVVLALAAGMGMALWQAGVAREQATQALQSKQFVLSLLIEANPGRAQSGIDYRVVDLLRNAAGRVERELERVPDLQAELRVEIANALLEIGSLDEARQLAEAGANQIRRLSGDQRERLVNALYVLARVHAQQGDATATSTVTAEALSLLDQLGTNPNLERARLLGMQARSENLRSRHDQALHLYERALAERLALGESAAQGVASIHNNIASTAVMAEHYATAESSYLQAAELLLSVHGPDHPRMAWVQLGLAAALTGLGRLTEAETLLDQAEQIALTRLGPESAVLPNLYNHRARLAELLGDTDTALAQRAAGLELARRIGATDLELAISLRHGTLLLALEKTDEAANVLAA